MISENDVDRKYSTHNMLTNKINIYHILIKVKKGQYKLIRLHKYIYKPAAILSFWVILYIYIYIYKTI